MYSLVPRPVFVTVQGKWHTITQSWDILLQRFLRGSNCQGNKILERKPFSNRLWSNLIGIQVSTVNCEALKHAPTVQPFHDMVSVLCSLVSCILPWTLSFMVTMLCHLCNALWVAHKYFGMCSTNRLGRSPDHFSPCGEKWFVNKTMYITSFSPCWQWRSGWIFVPRLL